MARASEKKKKETTIDQNMSWQALEDKRETNNNNKLERDQMPEWKKKWKRIQILKRIQKVRCDLKERPELEKMDR